MRRYGISSVVWLHIIQSLLVCVCVFVWCTVQCKA